ncbi:MAG: hypothetical protein RBQ91_00660 [Acholeplasma sp.]|nr:hypothetical protein [Acholeplasma sp.]
MNQVTYFENIIKELNSKPYHVVEKSNAVFYLVSKEEGIVSGLDEVISLLSIYDIEVSLRKHKENGNTVKRGEIVCSITGPKQSLYHVLDTVLYILGRMSGIASLVSYYQRKLATARVIDTKNYIPLEGSLLERAYQDGGAIQIPYYLLDETLCDSHDSYEDAVSKTKLITALPIALEVNDISRFYDALKTDAEILVLKYFNNEAIRRAILDNRGRKKIMIGGLILPNRLDIIGKESFDYLTTFLFQTASRVYEFAVKVG